MDKYRLTVKEVVQETPDTVTLVFQQPEPSITYQPGQFLTLLFQIDDKEVRRSYSLCSSLATDQDLAVTVKRVEEGLISNFINDRIQPQDEIEVLSPAGNFTPTITPDTKTHFVLFAGGSGITPLMSILKTALHVAPQSKVTLIYASRYEENIIFKDQLAQLVTQFPDRLNVIHTLTQPNENWQGHKGRLTSVLLRELLATLPPEEEKSYWTCGPDGMMRIVEEALSEQVHKESFVLTVKEATEVPATSLEDKIHQVEVHYAGDTYHIDVQPQQTILEAAMDKDIDLPYSCQSGLCTACMGQCISGKVVLEEDDCLTDDELNEGFILTCVAYPTSDDVVIKID